MLTVLECQRGRFAGRRGATPEMSQTQSVWKSPHSTLRPEGTPDSIVPLGRLIFWTANPARGAGLISCGASRQNIMPIIPSRSLPKSQRSSIPQPTVGPSRTGSPSWTSLWAELATNATLVHPPKSARGLADSKTLCLSGVTGIRGSVSWTAAGSTAPRRFRPHGPYKNAHTHLRPESGVAAPALPPHSKPMIASW